MAQGSKTPSERKPVRMVALTPRELAWVEAEAKRLQTSANEIIRRALDELIDRREAQRAGGPDVKSFYQPRSSRARRLTPRRLSRSLSRARRRLATLSSRRVARRAA